jgi:hypothetical protein
MFEHLPGIEGVHLSAKNDVLFARLDVNSAKRRNVDAGEQ